MARTHLIFTDAHAHPDHHNKRAEWLGKLIADVRPDVVINGGDAADMPSLCSYDKGTKAFHSASYARDLAAHGDFQERLWDTVRATKKKLPVRIALIGNHEQRIGRALNVQHELEGTIGYEDLELERFYDEVVEYTGSTPGTIDVDGICYAHYMVSGISGRPVSGEHPAYSHLTKFHTSCVVGHSHLLDFAQRTRADGRKINGLVAGCFSDWFHSFAGTGGGLWWRGACILKNVEDGYYDLETVSLDRIRKEYSK